MHGICAKRSAMKSTAVFDGAHINIFGLSLCLHQFAVMNAAIIPLPAPPQP
jgi:hypothetical protein